MYVIDWITLIRKVPFVVVISFPLISTEMRLFILALLVGTITAAVALDIGNGDTTTILDDANLKSKLLYFKLYIFVCLFVCLFCFVCLIFVYLKFFRDNDALKWWIQLHRCYTVRVLLVFVSFRYCITLSTYACSINPMFNICTQYRSLLNAYLIIDR